MNCLLLVFISVNIIFIFAWGWQFFYLVWVLFSIGGIVLASSLPNLDQYHLDFPLLQPFCDCDSILLKTLNTLVGVLVWYFNRCFF